MSSPTRDELLGYLLGALDPQQHEQVADELEQDHELRAEIRKLEACVGRLGLADRADHYDPPANLAARTCQLVAKERGPALVMRPAKDIGAGARRYTWADMLVAACALVTGGAMLFPAIVHSRNQSQVATCQNHLRYTGFGMHNYSDLQADRAFPAPEASGNRAAAGVFAVHLNDGKHVPSPAVFQCPSAPSVRPKADFRLPTLPELDAAEGEQLNTMQRHMGGDFGANMGFVKNGKLCSPCNSRRPNYALLSDAPSDSQPGRRSANHGGRGQNVFYEDGHVRFVTNKINLPDDLFHNRNGAVAAGIDCNDACLGCSQDSPMP